MKITEIKRRVDLLKMANNKKYCLIPELAKELKVSKTDLMQFILDNPKLFHTDNEWTYKYDTHLLKSCKNKNLGLGIEEVYLIPEDNYRTEEWLQKQITDKAKYIYISAFDNYGCIEGHYIEIDKDKESKHREWLWRNTELKVKEIQSLGITHQHTFWFGGYGDCSAHPVDYAINSDGLEKLKQHGWTFNELKPLSK